MTAEILAATLVGASRTAMHAMLMVVVIVVAAVAFAVMLWRHRREAATQPMTEEWPSGAPNLTPPDRLPTAEHDHADSGPAA